MGLGCSDMGLGCSLVSVLLMSPIGGVGRLRVC